MSDLLGYALGFLFLAGFAVGCLTRIAWLYGARGARGFLVFLLVLVVSFLLVLRVAWWLFVLWLLGFWWSTLLVVLSFVLGFLAYGAYLRYTISREKQDE